jgi:hypothetical protein
VGGAPAHGDLQSSLEIACAAVGIAVTTRRCLETDKAQSNVSRETGKRGTTGPGDAIIFAYGLRVNMPVFAVDRQRRLWRREGLVNRAMNRAPRATDLVKLSRTRLIGSRARTLTAGICISAGVSASGIGVRADNRGVRINIPGAGRHF